MKRSIETRIKQHILGIYLLVALACAGVLFYFYASWKEIHVKRTTVEEYNSELAQINALIYAVNEAQAEVNLFVFTQKRSHLRQFQGQAREIVHCIDSLKASRNDLGADSILSEIAQLLTQKEQSIIRLNRQYKDRDPIDTLSHTLSALSSRIQNRPPDSLATPRMVRVQEEPPKKSIWKRLTGVFSASRKEKEAAVALQDVVDTPAVARRDSLPVGQIVRQTRVNYDHHISALGSRFNSVVLADQYITSRITELLTQLYDRIIHARMEEIDRDEALLRKNNVRALVVGGVGLFLILILLVLILHHVNRGYLARQALERANARTRQLMESRHKLLLSVSHDVKTPLNSMLGYFELYRREGRLQASEVAPVANSGLHILALLNNLLEYSGLEKGSVQLTSRPFSPQELCADLCEMFLPLARKKSLRFTYREEFPAGLLVCADCLKIKQILTNVLSNAIKYTVEGEISFEAEYQDGVLELQVTDTGVGVPEDKQEDLFKPFSRVEENSVLDEGSGFGLYVVKGLVTLLEGELSFQSAPGRGTQVTIQLPAPLAEKQPVDESLKKILLVDDDEVFLDLLSRLCAQLGHQVVVCSNRSEFKEALQDIHTYHCVLTDMEMGSFTGEEVLKRVREADQEMPVILLTGRTDYNPGIAWSAGFTDYLLKPVTLYGLHARIGGEIREDGEKEEGAGASSKAADLSGFLGNDPEAVQGVMAHFFMATVDHLVQFREAIGENDFEKIQGLCHKMLPMFQHTGAPDAILCTMQQMDALRGAQYAPGDPIWPQLEALSTRIEAFLADIQRTYLCG